MQQKPFTPRVFGKYVLVERIAAGGMAEVYRAIQRGAEGLEKTVALKRVLPIFSEEREFLTLFVDEARIALTLTHANIAQTFDFGEVDGSHYLTLEMVEGIDLARLMERLDLAAHPMPVATAAFIVAEAARGLAYAHEKRGPDGQLLGIVHRDVSPQNILLSYAGEVKVADFGIAKAAGKLHKTATGVVMGKLRYMSPEQLAGVPLDARSDVFSLGVILYELLTGGPIFPDANANLAELIHAAPIPPPSARLAAIPPELDAIVLKALGRPRDVRYARAAELARDLTVYVNQSAPEFTRENLAALVARMAPPAERRTDALEVVAPAEGAARTPVSSAAAMARTTSLLAAPRIATPTTDAPATVDPAGVGPAPTRPAEAAAVRQLDVPTRTRLPDGVAADAAGRVAPAERPTPRRRRRHASAAWIVVVVCGLVIVGSGAAVVIRFVLPEAPAPRAPAAGGGAIQPTPAATGWADAAGEPVLPTPPPPPAEPFQLTPAADADVAALGRAVRGHDIVKFLTLGRDVATYLTALDWRIATLTLDGAGRPLADAPYPDELERLVADRRVGPAVDAVIAYVRATGALPPEVTKAVTVLLEQAPPFGHVAVDPKGGTTQPYSMAALAVWLAPRDARRLAALARANDALGRWCAPTPPPARRFAPLACEPEALAVALRAAGDDASAAALDRWRQATPPGVPAAVADGAFALRDVRVELGEAEATTIVSFALATPAGEPLPADAILLEGAGLVSPARPLGGEDGRFAFAVPRDAFALVARVTGPSGTVHLRIR